MSALTTETLSATGDRWIRLSAVSLIIIVAGSSFCLSYSGLIFIATASGINQGLAVLFPLCIDGMLLLGSASSLHSSLQRKTPLYGNLLVSFGVLLSIWGNIASAGNAGDNGIQAAIVHGVPPVALFLSLECGIQILRNRIVVSHAAAAEAKRQSEREAKRQQRVSEQAAPRGTGGKKSPIKANEPSRIVKVSGDEQGSVNDYRAIIEGMAPGSTKASLVEAVLMRFPDAKSAHIAAALEVQNKSIATTVVRVRERVHAQQTTASDANFHAIVKDFAPVGE